MFTVRGQRGGVGQEWARHSLFGVDRMSHTAPSVFRDVLLAYGVRAATALDHAANDVDTHAVVAGEQGPALAEVADRLREQAQMVRRVRTEVQQLAADRPFRVVFMGRTMAGKSTLFEFFSGGDGSRVGDGRQRYSRDSCARPSEVLGCEIVDTPGVGAMDGEDDFQVAFAQVADADLILWVASDQATQEQTGRALRQLGALGKPIVVALNCLADLDDPIAVMDLLEEPERVFGGDAPDNLHPIERHLGQSGARFIRAVPLHAQAALRSTGSQCDPATRQLMAAGSRVSELVEVLHTERDRTAAQRRVVSMCDRVRTGLLSAAGESRATWAALCVRVDGNRGSQRDFDRKAGRCIDDAHQRLLAAVTAITAGRERWVEEVDIEGDIDKLWKAEAQRMHDELTVRVTAICDQLGRSMEALSIDLAEDWAAFTPGTFEGLSGYGMAWMNRAAKVGSRVAAGAGIGALAGAPFGGVGAVPGAVIGAAVGLVATLLSTPVMKMFDKMVDEWFRSKAGVRRRRRQQIQEQLLPIVEASKVATTEKVRGVVDGWRRALRGELANQARQTDELERVTERLAGLVRVIEAVIGDIDTHICRELLRLCGRTRAATAVQRATRCQGVGIAADLRHQAFTELVLFPVADAVEPIISISSSSTFRPADALQVLMGLSAATISVTEMTRERLAAVIEEPMPVGVLEAWQSLIRTHTQVPVVLSSGASA